jgi:hypothetical protein
MSDDDFDFSALLEGVVADKPAPPPVSPPVPSPAPQRQDIGTDSLDDFLEAGVYSQSAANESVESAAGETKPWMKFHKFVLVRTVEEFEALVDKAIKRGRCAIDLEAEGFDNRIVSR